MLDLPQPLLPYYKTVWTRELWSNWVLLIVNTKNFLRITKKRKQNKICFFKEVFGHIIFLLIFFGLKHSTEARGKPMYFLVCNLFQKSTFKNSHSWIHFILQFWHHGHTSFTIILHIILKRVCPAYNKRPHLSTTPQDENKFKRFPLFG